MKTLRRDLLVAFLAITAFLSAIPILTYISFAATLSPRETLISSRDTGIKLLDEENRPFFTFYEARFKKQIPLSEVPIHTQHAIISIEDKDFYKHGGFSIPAIIRSFYENLRSQSLSYGGSTITQQLVKNSLLTPRKDFFRKFQEIILAQEIERRYSKQEILEMYLNSAYFGEGAFGIEDAARTYFNKQAKNLTVAESAILTAILPAPSRLSLYNSDLDEAKVRQRLILEKMQDFGYITKEEKQTALKEELEIESPQQIINNIAPHFALMVRDELIERYGEEEVIRSGMQVRTTLNLDWQKYAEDAVKKQVEDLRKNGASNGAAVVMDPKTAEVRVLVGSADWNDEKFGKVNITTSLRSPGSSFKPIVYVRGFENNLITPATILSDAPTSFANFDEERFFASFPSRSAALTALANDPNAFYRPQNFDRRFRGNVTVRRALSNSLNVPSVAVIKKVGIEETLNSAKNLGITTLKEPSDYGLSLVLGTGEVQLLELTNAYATFANKGFYNEPTFILDIKDKLGNRIYTYQPAPRQAVDEKYTFLISSILSDNRTRAEVFGTALNISRTAAVKTGTAEDFKDAWTMGYTPGLTIGVWIGNNFGEPMDGVAGSLGAAPIWKGLMERYS
ncbi:MAG: PBP1A family penicillin-binding protein, partial [Candidatus Daviesbacteria bacterium]|nr:PBP1A family penicillin-binding protein [Candidatus Daviesbacteria bacterium]